MTFDARGSESHLVHQFKYTLVTDRRASAWQGEARRTAASVRRQGLGSKPEVIESSTLTPKTMLKVKTKLLRVAAIPKGPQRDIAERANHDAQELAAMMRDGLSRCTCDEHPDEECIACLVVHENGHIELEKDFCCEEFEDQIDVKDASWVMANIPGRRRTSIQRKP